MRWDDIGIFWQDEPVVKVGRSAPARVMPEIPDVPFTKLRDLPDLSRAGIISVDCETNDESLEQDMGPGWARGVGNIAGISIGADDDGRWYFPIRHTIQPEDNYDPERILRWLNDQLSRPEQPKCGANMLYDVGWLYQEGVGIQGKLYDVQFAEALLDSDAFVSLEAQAAKYLGEHKQGDLVFDWCQNYYGGNAGLWQRRNLFRAPPRLVAPYGIGDADMPIRILEKQWPLLRREGLLNLFEMECALIPLLIAMRFAGVNVDINRAEEVRSIMADKEKELDVKLRDAAGMDVDVNSSDSLAKVFDRLGLHYNFTKPSKNFPNGRPSFTKDFLNTVKHPVAALIRDRRKWEKARSTFIEGYILESHINGKIYPSIHPLKSDENGTITGRFSMSNPNGQNLSAKDEEIGQLVRGCFVPEPDHKQWRKYDWSQLQYRFLAHYAVGDGADGLRSRYITDPKADYHEMVQKIVKEVTGMDVPRKPIKNVNFGVVFGMGEAHTCEIMGLPLQQARQLLEAIHAAAPYMKATLKHYSNEAKEYGIITTVLGRRTRFNLWGPGGYRKPDDSQEPPPGLPYMQALEAYGPKLVRAYTHKALNYKLQGSEGDLMKFCMLRAWNEGVFAVTGVPRLTVHDELDFSDPGGVDDAFDYLQHEIMEKSMAFKVPISAGCDVGANWGECL